MRFGRSAQTGALAGAACAACCAPPIIAALGIGLGLAATAFVFLGIAAAVAVAIAAVGIVGARRRGHRSQASAEPAGAVPVTLRARPSKGDAEITG